MKRNRERKEKEKERQKIREKEKKKNETLIQHDVSLQDLNDADILSLENSTRNSTLQETTELIKNSIKPSIPLNDLEHAKN